LFQPSLRNHPSLSRLGIHLHRLAIFPEPSSLAIPPRSARTSCSHTPSAPVPSCVRRRRRRPRWRRLAFHNGLAGRLSCSGRARRAGSAPRRLRQWDPCRASRGRRASSCGSATRTRCRCSSSAAMSDTGRRKKGRSACALETLRGWPTTGLCHGATCATASTVSHATRRRHTSPMNRRSKSFFFFERNEPRVNGVDWDGRTPSPRSPGPGGGARLGNLQANCIGCSLCVSVI
jgi:hypothetical protein